VIASPGLYSFDTRHAKSQPAPLCTPRAGGAIAVRKQPTGERRRQTGRRGMEGVRSGHRRAILGRAVLQRPLQGFLQPGGRPSGAGRRRVCALVGRGQSERINPDGAITGLPSLHATVATADRKRFLAYWQGQSMLGRLEYLTQWVKMSGFQDPGRSELRVRATRSGRAPRRSARWIRGTFRRRSNAALCDRGSSAGVRGAISLRRSQSEVLCGNGLGDITAERHFCDAAAVFVSPGCGRNRCHSIKSLERS
jgi:hypothetical protein